MLWVLISNLAEFHYC